ncbi:MAG: hypothetical protein ACRC5C_07125, partial [Bacilli bacterium]
TLTTGKWYAFVEVGPSTVGIGIPVDVEYELHFKTPDLETGTVRMDKAQFKFFGGGDNASEAISYKVESPISPIDKIALIKHIEGQEKKYYIGIQVSRNASFSEINMVLRIIGDHDGAIAVTVREDLSLDTQQEGVSFSSEIYDVSDHKIVNSNQVVAQGNAQDLLTQAKDYVGSINEIVNTIQNLSSNALQMDGDKVSVNALPSYYHNSKSQIIKELKQGAVIGLSTLPLVELETKVIFNATGSTYVILQEAIAGVNKFSRVATDSSTWGAWKDHKDIDLQASGGRLILPVR